MSSTPANALRFEIADIQRKLIEASKPAAWRSDADKRYFSRLLAGLRRRRARLMALEQHTGAAAR